MLPGSRKQASKRPKRILGSSPQNPGTPVNVALYANCSVPTGSSQYIDASSYPADVFKARRAINGDRKATNFLTPTIESHGGWHDGDFNTYPDTLVVEWPVEQTINIVDVFTIQDNYQNPIEPTTQLTFTQQGLVDFKIQYWNGSAWVDIPGASITGNNLVWRRFTFSEITTTKIRLYVTNALNSHSRVAEIEAWTVGTPNRIPPRVNIIEPVDGSSTGNTDITINAEIVIPTATGTTLTKIEVLRDAVVIFTNDTDPVAGQFGYTDTGVAVGNYTYTVIAYDETNNLEGQDEISIEITSSVSLGLFEARTQLEGVIGYSACEADSASLGNAWSIGRDIDMSGRHPHDNRGLWDPFQTSAGVIFVTSDGVPLPYPSLDTAVAPPGRSASIRCDIINHSAANAAGGIFFQPRGGQNHSTDFSSIPDLSDIDVALQGNNLLGIERWFQFLVRVNPAYVTEDIHQTDGVTFIGRKVFGLTRPNNGGTTSTFDNPTTDVGEKMIFTSTYGGGLATLVYYYSPDTGGTLNLETSRNDIIPFDQDFQPKFPFNQVPYASRAEANANPGVAYRPAHFLGGPHADEWNQVQAGIKLLEIINGPHGHPQEQTWKCKIHLWLYWGRPGEPETLVFDVDLFAQLPKYFWEKINLFPYLTNKSDTEDHSTHSIWYSSIIVSDRKLPSAAEVQFDWNPSWRVGAPLNEWSQIPGTAMSNYNFNTTTYETWNTGANGPQSPWSAGLIDSWGGFQFDDNTGDIYNSLGGGHSDNICLANSVKRFRLTTDSPIWEFIKESSPYGPLYPGTPLDNPDPPPAQSPAHYSDGGPAPAHVFNNNPNIIYAGADARIVLPTAGSVNPRGNGGDSSNVFNLTTLEWNTAEQRAVPTGRTINSSRPQAYDSIKTYPNTRKIFHLHAAQPNGEPPFFIYDDATDTWSTISVGGVGISALWYGSDMIIDTVRDRGVIIGQQGGDQKKALIIEDLLAGPRTSTVVNLSGSGSGVFYSSTMNYAGHDTINDMYYIMQGDALVNNLFSVDPESFDVTYLGQVESVGNLQGAVGRTIHFFRALRAIVYISRFISDIYFYPVAN
jgi:hypothetical protein